MLPDGATGGREADEDDEDRVVRGELGRGARTAPLERADRGRLPLVLVDEAEGEDAVIVVVAVDAAADDDNNAVDESVPRDRGRSISRSTDFSFTCVAVRVRVDVRVCIRARVCMCVRGVCVYV